jgi:hypothetical protein
MDEPTVPCEICGDPTIFTGTKRCCRCWEVEARLKGYLANAKGQAYARGKMPLLDDWVDGEPDAWDYEAVLRDNKVKVVWDDTIVDCDGNPTKVSCDWLKGWSLTWKHGVIFIGNISETMARKAAALYVSLWLRGVSASFADKLMDGYIYFLLYQETATLCFLGTIDYGVKGPFRFRLTREGMMERKPLEAAQKEILAMLNVQPDEEVLVRFEKRKKQDG